MMWSEQEAYIFNDKDKADNEIISNEGFIYVRGNKPTVSQINDLRHIKKVRRFNYLNNDIKPVHPLSNELNELSGLRNERRTEHIKKIALNLIQMYNERGVKRITNEDINDLVNLISNKDLRSKVRKDIIALLLSNGLIQKDVYRKAYYSFINKPLLTYEKFKNGKVIKVECGSNVSIGRVKQTHKVIVYNII